MVGWKMDEMVKGCVSWEWGVEGEGRKVDWVVMGDEGWGGE